MGDERVVESDRPHVGGWGWAIVFFGWIGGLIGYFSLKSDDEQRANHVMKWGLIWSLGSVAAWTAVVVAIIVAFSAGGTGTSVPPGAASNGAPGATGSPSPTPPPATTSTINGSTPNQLLAGVVALPYFESNCAGGVGSLTASQAFVWDDGNQAVELGPDQDIDAAIAVLNKAGHQVPGDVMNVTIFPSAPGPIEPGTTPEGQQIQSQVYSVSVAVPQNQSGISVEGTTFTTDQDTLCRYSNVQWTLPMRAWLSARELTHITTLP